MAIVAVVLVLGGCGKSVPKQMTDEQKVAYLEAMCIGREEQKGYPLDMAQERCA